MPAKKLETLLNNNETELILSRLFQSLKEISQIKSHLKKQDPELYQSIIDSFTSFMKNEEPETYNSNFLNDPVFKEPTPSVPIIPKTITFKRAIRSEIKALSI